MVVSILLDTPCLFMNFIIGLLNLGFSWVEIGSVTPKPQVCNSLVYVLFS
jgi:dihydroorotate dehydrogenase